jgi:D-aminopeptidase
MGPEKFQCRRGIAFDRGRSGRLAGLNAAHIGALAVRKQLENLGLQMPPQDKLAPEALGARQKAEIAKWWPVIKAVNDVKVDYSA